MDRSPIVVAATMSVMLGLGRNAGKGCEKAAMREGCERATVHEMSEARLLGAAADVSTAGRWSGPLSHETSHTAANGLRAELIQSPNIEAYLGERVERAATAEVSPAHIVAAASPDREADRLARQVIDDIVDQHPEAVLAELRRLVAAGKELSPQMRMHLVSSVGRQSAPVARRLDAALHHGTPLDDAGISVVVERGRFVVVRDIEALPRLPYPGPPTGLPPVVFVDTRLKVGREGLLIDHGHDVAFWSRQRGAKVEQLEADEIGELPDRFVEVSTGMTAERTSGALPETRSIRPNPVFLIRRCIASHNAEQHRDAC